MSYFSEFWKGGEGQTEAAFHSSAFHKYFEGYVEEKKVDPATGKTRIVRTYTAPYYVRQGSDAEWKWAKVLTVCLYLLSMVLLILSATVLELESPAKYYQIFVAGGLVCAFYILYVFIQYLSAPRKMTIGNYRAFYPALHKSCLVASVFIFAAIPARLLNAILTANAVSAELILGFVCLAGSGASMLGIYLRERETIYDIVDNEQAGETGFQIRR